MGIKVVILAAGLGSRLGNPELPKPLTPLVNGKSILELQIDRITNLVPKDKIILVVGYRYELLIQSFPDLTYVFNPDFAKENTAKSLSRALAKIEGEDLLWLNGDVVFSENILSKLFESKYSSMVVNQGAVDDEAVKYLTDERGLITAVSKDIVDPEGESLGVNLFRASDLVLLKRQLILCENQDYFEKAVECCIQQGTKVSTTIVSVDSCVEVDFPEDLEKAKKLLI